MTKKPPTQTVAVTGHDSLEISSEAILWSVYSFAPEWFEDPAAEATRADHQARRREILFAVTAAESYVFEWVRDTVLLRDFFALRRYFPVGAKRGVKEKYKEVIKELANDNLIPAALDCGGQQWQEFSKLVDFRDGLVHAKPSRPETAGLSAYAMLFPSKSTLDSYPPGKAVSIVRELLNKLHSDSSTTRPAWLTQG